MIKCIAIDDEPIALNILEEYCRRYGNLDIECYTSPIEGMARIAAVKPDIVFLDIEMNSHNGVALARELPQGSCLIFTTAFSQYAFDGFEVDAIDFLHKPIFYPRFEKAIQKALKYIGHTSPATTGHRDSVTFKVEHRTVIIGIDDITHIEAMDNYVKVFRRNAPMILSQITMKETESMLPSDRFIRVHRSYIVALGAIESFSNRRIYISGTQSHIPVGRKYIESFNRVYDKKTFNNRYQEARTNDT